jgi:hypothetical protein
MTLALILAGLAVAWLLWSRPAVPAGLPPLSPLPAPSLPPMAPVAAGGLSALQAFTLAMNVATIAIAALALSAFWNQGNQPTPAPGPAPVVGLDLRGRFVGPDAAADAATTAALLGALADDIEYDGLSVDKEGKPKEPRLKTGASFDDLRRIAREIRCQGVSLGARQPAVRDEIKRFLDAEAGTEGGPVDAAARARWVKAYRAVSQAAAEATR